MPTQSITPQEILDELDSTRNEMQSAKLRLRTLHYELLGVQRRVSQALKITEEYL